MKIHALISRRAKSVKARLAIGGNRVNELKHAICAENEVSDREPVHQIGRGLHGETLIRQKSGHLQLTVGCVSDRNTGEKGNVLKFKSADVHARPLRSSDAALVGRGCASGCARINRRTAGKQSHRQRRAAVVGERAKHEIYVGPAAAGGKRDARIRTDVVTTIRNRTGAIAGNVARQQGVKEMSASRLRPHPRWTVRSDCSGVSARTTTAGANRTGPPASTAGTWGA